MECLVSCAALWTTSRCEKPAMPMISMPSAIATTACAATLIGRTAAAGTGWEVVDEDVGMTRSALLVAATGARKLHRTAT